MNTDTPLYEIFHQHPEWIADLMNEPFPEPSTFTAPVFKHGERRLDGLLTPFNPRKALRVIEFQFFPSADIYYRAVEERIAVHRKNPGRDVEVIIVFAQRKLDKRPAPWHLLVHSVYQDEEMIILAQRQPAPPLPKLLLPVLEKNETKLENTAPTVYEELGKLQGTTPEQRHTLQRIFTNLFLSRFKTKTLQEINAMLRTLDVTKTRAGKELIALGKAEGKTEGKAEGKAGMLLQIFAKRFGKLPAAVVHDIEHLDFLQLETLGDKVLEIADIKTLSAWIKKVK